MPRKDVGESYAYQRRMEAQGYERLMGYTFGWGIGEKRVNPIKFYNDYQPDSDNAWEWRRAIKKFLKEQTEIPKQYEYKIVKAVGYWDDIWLFVYEIWIKEK